jgi:hypothetical protein
MAMASSTDFVRVSERATAIATLNRQRHLTPSAIIIVMEDDHGEEQTSEPELPGFPGRVPDLRPGKYQDGTPLHEMRFLECKLILKPDRFTSTKSFRKYAKLVERAAEENDVEYTDKAAASQPKIREVLFLDTASFRLYNNAFILMRRIHYKDGFAAGEPEIVLKFRHPEMQRAAEMDVRPRITGKYDLKFKAEALPLKDQVGGYRLLFSHNVEFGLSQAPESNADANTGLPMPGVGAEV